MWANFEVCTFYFSMKGFTNSQVCTHRYKKHLFISQTEEKADGLCCTFLHHVSGLCKVSAELQL